RPAAHHAYSQDKSLHHADPPFHLVRQRHQRIVPAYVRREYTKGRWGRKRLALEYYGMDCYISHFFSPPFQAAGVLMYCLEVKKRLSSLDIPSKREALAALDVHVTWAPGERIQVEGNIGVVTTSSISKYVKVQGAAHG